MPSDEIRPGAGAPGELLRLVGGYAALLERLPLVTYIADLDDGNRLRWVSPQVEALAGYPASDWV
jgi:PAS domain-containing protein